MVVNPGKRPDRVASIRGRNVAVQMPQAPVLRGNILSVRVRVKEGNDFRGIGRWKVRNETINFVNLDPRLPIGPLVTVQDAAGRDIQVPSLVENAALALDVAIEDALRTIGLSDNVEAELGRTTTVVYPDTGAGPTGGSIDGDVVRAVASESFATIRGGAGTTAVETSTSLFPWIDSRSLSSGNYKNLRRSIMTFDTSSIGDDEVSSAILALYGKGKLDQIGHAPRLAVTSVSPAADDDIATADYAIANYGGTEFASVTYAGFSTSAYNDFEFDAAGRSHINGAGVTALAAMLGHDIDNSEPSWAAGLTYIEFWAADNGANKPRLTIEHAAAAAAGGSLISGVKGVALGLT